MSRDILSKLDKRYMPSTIASRDGRFSLRFKPALLQLNDPNGIGVYLYEGNDRLLFAGCSSDSGWHDAECELLGRIDSLGYDDETKKSLEDFIWSVIVNKDRERYENEKD